MIEPTQMSITEFDAWTMTAPEGFTYELQDGIVYSFATGSEEHGLLVSRLAGWLIPALIDPCRVHLGTIAVRRRPERPSSVVPDTLVTCEPRIRGNAYVSAPKLVVEVMSRSSVTNDLLRKPVIYGAIESIDEYLVIDSRDTWARVFRRDDEHQLAAGEDFTTVESRIELRTVPVTFTLAELYSNIV